jgi:hypothetical protein
MGLLCAFGCWSLGLNIGTLLSLSDRLSSGKPTEKFFRWEPE